MIRWVTCKARNYYFVDMALSVISRYMLCLVRPVDFCFSWLSSMMIAVDALSPEAQQAAIAKLSSELSSILDNRDVPGWLQARIAHVGALKVGTFGRIEGTEKEVREWVVDTLKVDPSADPTNRTAIATVVDAWQASKKRLDRRDDVEAEERASKLPKTIPKKDYVNMKLAHSKTYLGGKPLPDYETPHHEGFETSCDQIEDGEIIAEDLKEIASEKEAKKDPSDNLTPIFQRDGYMKIRVKKNQVPPPTDSEGYRWRMRLLSVKWVMIRDKYPNNALLQSMGPGVFNSHAEFILGPEVVGLDARDAFGAAVARPTWATAMSFELEVRKKAFSRFNEERIPLAMALSEAQSDPGLRQRFLHIPFSISAAAVASSAHKPQSLQPVPKQPQQMGIGNLAKVTRNQAQKLRKFKDQNGAEICNKFQRDLCMGDCGRSHVCGYCLGNHSLNRCPLTTAAPPQAPPQGKGGGKGYTHGGWYGKGKGGAKGFYQQGFYGKGKGW